MAMAMAMALLIQTFKVFSLYLMYAGESRLVANYADISHEHNNVSC